MKKRINHSEVELEILRKIEENPNLTQRQIAEHLELSLGKINYLIKALLAKGLLKMNNFRGSGSKLGYLYLLTPQGVDTKRKLTMLFLQRKSKEFDKLKKEMEQINNS
ncbi:MarR family EPS-associated transcriptional regulator [Gammaproteobacteria bacterium]|nr:MarR family EPS-associated transcriptional regulator [Gammaproteobacteria bacterium]